MIPTRTSIGTGQIAPTSQPYEPKRTISAEIELDATDQLEDEMPGGIDDRLAALEQLLMPSEGLIGELISAVGELAGNPPLPKRSSVPIVLLILGPGASFRFA